MTEADELEAGALALGVGLNPSQIESLVRFAALLRRWNNAFNLVSRRDVPRLAARHLLDALSLVPMVVGRRVLDLGTGAGLPGVPLAIARPDIEFTLLDRSERRIRFVRQATLDLGLQNVVPVSADYADFRPGSLFDTVVSRAVAKPVALWRAAAPCVAIALLLGAWSFFSQSSAPANDLSQALEQTLLAAVDQDQPADSAW